MVKVINLASYEKPNNIIPIFKQRHCISINVILINEIQQSPYTFSWISECFISLQSTNTDYVHLRLFLLLLPQTITFDSILIQIPQNPPRILNSFLLSCLIHPPYRLLIGVINAINHSIHHTIHKSALLYAIFLADMENLYF